MNKSAKRVLLGAFARAHGIRGEVVVRSFCEPPEDIAAYGLLTTETGDRTFELKLRGGTAKGLIARVKGIDDRNAADLLRGIELYVARDQLTELDDDEIYQDDLIGLRVEDPAGAHLGDVVAVQNFGAGDLLEVQLPAKKRTEFLPFEPQFVVAVDLEARRIVIAIDPSDPEDDKAAQVAAQDAAKSGLDDGGGTDDG